MTPTCDMLIDQQLTIDGDPFGRCCGGVAVYQDGTYYYCERCADQIVRGYADGIPETWPPRRITWPRGGSVRYWAAGVEYTQRLLRQAIKVVTP